MRDTSDHCKGDSLRQLVIDQEEVLNHKLVRDAANRQGLRRESGDLLTNAYLDLITTLRPQLSVEIGAHEGSFSLQLKERLPSIRALAFEANPFVYDQYVDQLRPEIDYERAAIWNRDGEMDFSIPISLKGRPISRANAISSTRGRFHDGFEYEKVNVRTRRLDTVLSGAEGLRSVAWVDAEGAQREVLEGGHQFFSRVLAIYIELEREEIWSGQTLDARLIECLADHGLQLIMIDNLASVQYNTVFVRSGMDSEVRTIVWDYLKNLRAMVGVE